MKCEAFGNAVGQKIEFKEDAISEWPHSWPKGEISYRLNNYTGDITQEKFQDRAVTVALRVWQLRINDLKFRRERNPDAHVDFNVSFQPLDKFSSSNVLAHAWYPGQGEISGDCEINDNWMCVPYSKIADIGHPPLVPILIHEFGHSLGLSHDVTTKESIMYPSFNLGQKKNDLGPNDIQRIQDRYGKRSLSKRIIDYFRYRRDQGFDFR